MIIMHVPQIQGLKVNQILKETRNHVDINDYVPDLKDEKLPNRYYVINVGMNESVSNIDSQQSYARFIVEDGGWCNGAERWEIH